MIIVLAILSLLILLSAPALAAEALELASVFGFDHSVQRVDTGTGTGTVDALYTLPGQTDLGNIDVSPAGDIYIIAKEMGDGPDPGDPEGSSPFHQHVKRISPTSVVGKAT